MICILQFISFHFVDRWQTSALQSEWKVEHGRFVAHQSTWLQKLFWAKYEHLMEYFVTVWL